MTKIEIKEERGSKIIISFAIDDENIFKKFGDKAIADLGKDLSLKGYRPGKIPAAVLKKSVDEKLVQSRTLEMLAEDYLKKEVVRLNIFVLETDFKLLKYIPGKLAEFDIEITTIPKYAMPDYKKIAEEFGKNNKKESTLSDKEISEALEFIRKSRAKYVSSSYGAKPGDFIEIDFEASTGGTRLEDYESKNYPFVLGEGKLIPGFEKEIEELKSNDTKEFSLTAPKDYWREDLQNKKIDFKVKINSVLNRELPELNDDFAKQLGSFDGMESLKESLKGGLLTEKRQKDKNDFTLNLLKQILLETKIELPQMLIDREVEKIMHDFEHDIVSKGIEKEKYLKQIGKSEDQLKKDIIPQAENNIKTSLILKDIAVLEKIEIAEEKIKERVNDFLKELSSTKKAEKEVDPENLYYHAKEVLKNQDVIEKLLLFAGYKLDK